MTTSEILALPIFAFGYREKTIDGRRVRIPVMPNVKCHYVAPDDAMWAIDEDGNMWAPISTDEGWMRHRL